MRRGRSDRGRRLLGWVGLAVMGLLLAGSLLVARQGVSYAIYPSRTVIRVGDREDGSFLRARDVAAVLPLDLTDSISRGVDPHRIERDLVEASTYISSATAFVSPSSMRLHVIVRERVPIVRYFRGGTSWYLDQEGISVPQRQGAAAYVPIAGGEMTDGTISYLLYPLAGYLHSHRKWSHFFVYIEILPDSRIHLHPRIGTAVFELHGIDTLERDLEKIPVYYREIEPRVGTDKYHLVKLSYDNQIVCVRKKNSSKNS